MAAAIGIAGVVAVFVGVLSIAAGFPRAVTSVGPDDIAIVLRSGADNEMTSGLSRRKRGSSPMLPAWRAMPTPARFGGAVRDHQSAQAFHGHGRERALSRRRTGALAVRGDIQIVEGRPFERGQKRGHRRGRRGAGIRRSGRGRDASARPEPMAGGGRFHRRRRRGGIGDVDRHQPCLQSAYHRGDTFQSVYAKLETPRQFQASSRTRSPPIRSSR